VLTFKVAVPPVTTADTVKDGDMLSRRWMFWNDGRKGTNSDAMSKSGGDHSLEWWSNAEV
jgi:hypothetical protein